MLAKTPIYKALNRPILFVGCERLPFTVVTTLCGVILMTYQTLLVATIVLVLYLVFIALIRRVNIEDPQFFRCLYRYARYYQDYYPANEFYPGKVDAPQTFWR